MDGRIPARCGGTATSSRAAVSLHEVLVVIGVILLLFGMLLPSYVAARESARRAHCANNQRQWGVGERCYRDDYEDYLYPFTAFSAFSLNFLPRDCRSCS